LQQTPSKTFVINRGQNTVFIGGKETPFARQVSYGGATRYNPADDTKFVASISTETVLPRTAIFRTSSVRMEKDLRLGLGQTKQVAEFGEIGGFSTRALFFNAKTNRIKDVLKVRGSSLARPIDERRFVGVGSSRFTRGKQRGKDFGTFRGYNLPDVEASETVGTRIVTQKFKRGSRVAAQTIVEQTQTKVTTNVIKNIQNANTLRTFPSVKPIGATMTASFSSYQTQSFAVRPSRQMLQTQQKESYKLFTPTSQGMFLDLGQTEQQKDKAIPLIKIITMQRQPSGNRGVQFEGIIPIESQGTSTRQASSFPFGSGIGGIQITSQTLPPYKPFILPPIWGRLPTFSEGKRKKRRYNVPSSRFNYQPSFTALIRDIRGGSKPSVIMGGFDPFILRTINPRTKRSKKKKKK
jgi:hypothetical protein